MKNEGPIVLTQLIENWLKEHYSEKAGITGDGSIFIWSEQKPAGPIFFGLVEQDRVTVAHPNMKTKELPAAKEEFFQELETAVKAWLKKEKSNG